MTGPAALILALAWTLGPSGHLIDRQLAAANAELPLAGLRSAAAGTWVVFHGRRSWARAFYTPPEDNPLPLALAAGLDPEGASPSLERLLPGLRLPRIFLYAPYYRAGGGLVELGGMPVDVAEHYFNALTEAWLDRELRDPASGYGRRAAERAAVLMTEVPEPRRLGAYVAAAADFGSHVLSIAHEIARADRRARARGEDLCALIDPPRLLFALWRRSFAAAPYPGRYFAPAAEGAAGRWVLTRAILEPVDKELILEGLFGGFWTGDPARDFGHLCP